MDVAGFFIGRGMIAFGSKLLLLTLVVCLLSTDGLVAVTGIWPKPPQ